MNLGVTDRVRPLLESVQAFIRDRLFRPFDSTKGKAGLGIGVYEARDYIHKLGGDLEVISRVGEGSTFRVRLSISEID